MNTHFDTNDKGLSVVVRFHDVRRLRELDRAIFSLTMQHYRPLHIHLCLQRFSKAEIAATKAKLDPILAINGAPSLNIHNWIEPEPIDARSILINLGVSNIQTRYLAFLDYDDVLYPEAYELLIRQLQASRSVVCFGRIGLKTYTNYANFDYAESKSFPFQGTSVLELMRGNFCPIHSFVVDTKKVSRHILFFDPTINRNEDYDFLLRLVAKYPSDFSLIETFIGEYYIKRDGSNTILTEYAATPEAVQAWDDAECFVEGRRRSTMVSEEVQRSLGIAQPSPRLTIRRLLDSYAELKAIPA